MLRLHPRREMLALIFAGLVLLSHPASEARSTPPTNALTIVAKRGTCSNMIGIMAIVGGRRIRMAPHGNVMIGQAELPPGHYMIQIGNQQCGELGATYLFAGTVTTIVFTIREGLNSSLDIYDSSIAGRLPSVALERACYVRHASGHDGPPLPISFIGQTYDVEFIRPGNYRLYFVFEDGTSVREEVTLADFASNVHVMRDVSLKDVLDAPAGANFPCDRT